MGYQALLFCPEEKISRTVTQVLTELDFAIVPCSEPFAAVKKLMAEHFDAVVVDCDNEQNATLLFKSAHNSASNQSSLAVAVVEGQAGVAKAFRIGANLVLTKPINVEQAKGTLRVARGLLRKGEPGKAGVAAQSQAASPAPANASPTPKPAATAPKAAPPRPVAPAASTAAPPKLPPRPASAVPAPAAKSSSPAPTLSAGAKPDSASAQSEDSILAPEFTSQAPAAKTTPAPRPSSPVAARPGSGIFATGAASAPAPAREIPPSTLVEAVAAKQSESQSIDSDILDTDASTPSTVPAPSFTFGGNLFEESPSSEGGSKKIMLIVAAVVVVAVAGYLGWSQFHGKTSAPAHVAQPAAPATSAQPVTPPPAPSAQPAPATSAPSSAAAAPASTPAQPDTSEDTTNQPAPVSSKPVPAERPAKSASKSAEPSAAPAKASATTKPAAQPIVVRNETSKPPVTKPAASTDAPAPSAMGIAPSSTSPLPSLVSQPAATPKLQTMSVSQGVSQGLLYKKVQPAYPSGALRLHLEGAVQLMATISKSGDITTVKVLSGDSTLAKAATDAVKQWKYKPYLLNGEPVEIQTQITVNFKLPR